MANGAIDISEQRFRPDFIRFPAQKVRPLDSNREKVRFIFRRLVTSGHPMRLYLHDVYYKAVTTALPAARDYLHHAASSKVSCIMQLRGYSSVRNCRANE